MELKNKLELALDKQGPWSKRIDVHIRIGEYIAQPLLMKKPNNLDIIQKPTFSLDYETCQEIVDSLWNFGFRPSEGTGSAGSLKATQNHLEDMRKLVFERT